MTIGQQLNNNWAKIRPKLGNNWTITEPNFTKFCNVCHKTKAFVQMSHKFQFVKFSVISTKMTNHCSKKKYIL